MLSSFLSSESGLSSGGTITGDLTIDGELTVSGTGAFAYTEVVTGDMAITNAYDTVGLTITQGGDNYALKIVQNDADKAALFIDAATTTSHLIYIDGPLTTTGSTIRMDGLAGLTSGSMFNANITSVNLQTGLSTGAFRIIHSANSTDKESNIMHLHNDNVGSVGVVPLKLQQDSIGQSLSIGVSNAATTAFLDSKGIYLDYDKSGIVADGVTGTLYGYDLDIDDSATNHSGSTVTMTGGRINVASTSNSGTNKNIGLDVTVSGATTNYAALFNGGNVGIGTAVPATGLHVVVSGNEGIEIESDSAAVLTFDHASNDEARILFQEADTVEGSIIYDSTGTDSLQFKVSSNGLRFKLDANSRISLSNNDGSATTGADGTTGNTIFGYLASPSVSDSGFNNVAVGHKSLNALTHGDENTAIGTLSMYRATSSPQKNVAVGGLSMSGNWTSADVDGCVVVGYDALSGTLTGGGGGATGSTAIGYQSLKALTSGSGNVAMGYQTGLLLTAGQYNTVMGEKSLWTDDYGDFSTAIGYNSLYKQDTNGTSNVTTGNTGLGAYSGFNNVTGINNTYVGYKSGFGVSGNSNSNNVGVGANALVAITTGGTNVAIGVGAGSVITDGANNIAIGAHALNASTTASNNVTIGNDSMGGITAAVQYAVAIGKNAFIGSGSTTTGANGAVAIGYNSLTGLTTGSGNVAVGYQAGTSINSDGSNVSVGYESSKYMYGGSNVAVGKDALLGATFTDATCDYNHTGGSPRVVAHDANASIIAGLGVSGTGIPDGAYIASRDTSTQFTINADATATATNGTLTFYSRTSGAVAIGTDALTAFKTGSGNTAVGNSSMSGVMIGALRNTAIGTDSLFALTTGDDNTCVGASAGTGITSGIENVAIGKSALQTVSGGHYNVAVGWYALSTSSGNSNTGVGYQAGDVIQAGTSNTCIGHGTDPSAHGGTNQTVVGAGTTGQADNSVTLGNASVTDVYAASDSGATVHAGGATLVAALGAEKVTNGTFTGNATGWTVTSGWAYSSNTMLKNGDSTTTLSQDTTEVAAEIYKVEYTISSHSVGSVTVSIGGVSGRTRTGDGTFVEYILATGTGNLTFTPSNTSRFTLDTVSAKKVGKGAADQINTWSADTGVSAGNAGLHIMAENGTMHVIGNKVGIGTLEPNQLLHTWAPSGDVKNYIQSNDSNDAQTQYANTSTTYSSGIQSNRYVIARHGDLADTNYQRLIIDGDGAVTMPVHPAVLAIMGRFQTEGANSNTMSNLSIAGSVPVIFNFEKFDQGSNFNSTTKTGRADATETDKLHDADGGFEDTDVGALVYNTTDNTYATITSFQDSGEVTLEALGNDGADIMANNDYYVISHSVFTAPVTGKYMVTANVRLSAIDTASTYTNIYMQASNRSAALTLDFEDTDIGAFTTSQSMLMDMDANDTLKVLVRQGSGTKQLGIIGDSDAGDGHAGVHPYTALSVHLVC